MFHSVSKSQYSALCFLSVKHSRNDLLWALRYYPSHLLWEQQSTLARSCTLNMIDKRADGISSHNTLPFQKGAEFRARAARYWQNPNPRTSHAYGNSHRWDTASYLVWNNRRPAHQSHNQPITSEAHGPLPQTPAVHVRLCWAAERNRRWPDCIIASITEIIYTSIISLSARILFPSRACQRSSLVSARVQLRHAKTAAKRRNANKARDPPHVLGWCTQTSFDL